jgi:hypothetical protein
MVVVCKEASRNVGSGRYVFDMLSYDVPSNGREAIPGTGTDRARDRHDQLTNQEIYRRRSNKELF